MAREYKKESPASQYCREQNIIYKGIIDEFDADFFNADYELAKEALKKNEEMIKNDYPYPKWMYEETTFEQLAAIIGARWDEIDYITLDYIVDSDYYDDHMRITLTKRIPGGKIIDFYYLPFIFCAKDLVNFKAALKRCEKDSNSRLKIRLVTSKKLHCFWVFKRNKP